jgi:hypothetical protein
VSKRGKTRQTGAKRGKQKQAFDNRIQTFWATLKEVGATHVFPRFPTRKSRFYFHACLNLSVLGLVTSRTRESVNNHRRSSAFLSLAQYIRLALVLTTIKNERNPFKSLRPLCFLIYPINHTHFCSWNYIQAEIGFRINLKRRRRVYIFRLMKAKAICSSVCNKSPFTFSIMLSHAVTTRTKPLSSSPRCHVRACGKPSTIIYGKEWFCTLHALIAGKISQVIRRLGGQQR